MTDDEITDIRAAGIPIYGDLDFRYPKVAGKKAKPKEDGLMATMFNQMRDEAPDLWAIAVHHANEGARNHHQVSAAKSKGSIKTGACDLHIPGNPSFQCELKLQDCKESELQPGQINYLVKAKANGAFVCFAFGWRAGWQAFRDWRRIHYHENYPEA